jgi:hypothetical protein
MKTCANIDCPSINPQTPDNFSASSRHKDGRLRQCKTCVNNYRRELALGKEKIPCVFNACTGGKANAETGLCAGHYRQLRKGYELQPLIPGKQVRQNFNGDEKLCNTCKRWFPLNSFGPAKGLSGGVSNMCRRCHACWKYNITSLDYEVRLKEQAYGCKICNKSGVPLFVDHDHSCCPGNRSCGKCIRALLCHKCNSGLGMFNDNEETLSRALAYIRRYQ